MLNFPPARYQADGLKKQDEYSEASGLDASDRETNRDRTRQEFKEETDINVILSRFGVTGDISTRALQYADVDYDMGPQEAHQAVREMRDAWVNLPTELRATYRTPEELLHAAAAGDETYRELMKKHFGTAYNVRSDSTSEMRSDSTNVPVPENKPNPPGESA